MSDIKKEFDKLEKMLLSDGSGFGDPADRKKAEFKYQVLKKKLKEEKSSINKQMKIFISHSSKNSDYGNALVDLLIGVGIKAEEIIFTSNDAYGIPLGKNIFSWLKNTINEKPYVIYLLSSEYYNSVACLNEMGAAWIVENEHIMIFTPDFKLESYEFRNGAIDPREIGFRINNQNKLIEFIELCKKDFDISSNPVLINQKITDFLQRIKGFNTIKTKSTKSETIKIIKEKPENSEQGNATVNKTITFEKVKNSRLLTDLANNKLKDEEVLLIHYILETGRYKLGTGWQENYEIEKIRAWEDINELDNVLSQNYSGTLTRFEMRNLTEVSELTSNGNPKEIKLTDKVQTELLDISDELKKKILDIVKKNPKKELW